MLIADGAWGTMLQAAGLPIGECPELWNSQNHDAVLGVATAYINAGAELIKTNSFGANALRLQNYGITESAYTLARTAAEISKEATRGTGVFVAGSVGPTGKLPDIDSTEEQEYRDAFTEQVQGLIDGGVDVLLLETFYSPVELMYALGGAALHPSIPVICSVTYNQLDDGTFRTMTGATPEEMISIALTNGADILGVNCGAGLAETLALIKMYRSINQEVLLSAMPNAGLPEVQGFGISYPEDAEKFATYVEKFFEQRVGLLGGCCGSTPAHIRAMKNRYEALGNSR